MKSMTKVLLASALAAGSSLASAEVTFSGNVALTTDYVFRGISQTDGAAVQGGFDLEHSSGFYAGVWASNVDFADGTTDIEVDVYAGLGGEFSNKIGYDVGVIRYIYPDSSVADAADYDLTEIYGGLSYDFGPVAVSGKVSYSSDGFAGFDNTTYIEVGADIPLPNGFGLGLHYGDYDIDVEASAGGGNFDYNDWKVALTKSLGGFDFELGYTDTDLSDNNDCAGANICDSRFVFTVSKSL